MTALWDTIQTALWNVFHRPGLSDIIDILIVTVIIYFLLMMTRQTRASAVLKGLVVLLIATFVSDLLGLTALNWLLMSVVNNGAVVLVILFQPEIRKALEQLGRGAVRENSHAGEGEDQARIIDEIIQCMTDLSRRRVGALIVFEQKTGLKDVIETGTAVDARISAPLLENIFEPNTPLHDGAVVIRGTRVVAGACILTLTEGRGISRELGTRPPGRHRYQRNHGRHCAYRLRGNGDYVHGARRTADPPPGHEIPARDPGGHLCAAAYPPVGFAAGA